MARTVDMNSACQKAIRLFNAKLPQRATLGDYRFRQMLLRLIMSETGVGLPSAASMYNNAKHLAVRQKLTPEFSRRARTLARSIPAGAKYQLSHKDTKKVLASSYTSSKVKCNDIRKGLINPSEYQVAPIPPELIKLSVSHHS
jgi:hypothetical protein